MLNRVKKLMGKAQHSNFYLWLLNRLFYRAIPFNGRHNIRIKNIKDDSVETIAPFRRRNKNHINGMHACSIATISEFAAGLSFLKSLDPSQYRFILSELSVTYHYQGKTACRAIAELTEADIQTKIMQPLSENESVEYQQTSMVYDQSDQHIATCLSTWQIKDWQKVKTKL